MNGKGKSARVSVFKLLLGLATNYLATWSVPRTGRPRPFAQQRFPKPLSRLLAKLCNFPVRLTVRLAARAHQPKGLHYTTGLPLRKIYCTQPSAPQYRMSA